MSDVGASKAPVVPNYLTWAILSTIFCCLPFGIVSIVFAAQVNGKLALGDYQAAVATSERARRWVWIAFGVGLVEKLVLFAFLIASIVLAYRWQGRPPMPVGPGH